MSNHPDQVSAIELGSNYLVSQTRNVLRSKDSWSGKFQGLKESPRWNSNNSLDVRVAPRSIGSALAFMKAFIDYGLERGQDIIVKYGETKVVIQGQEEQISFRERTRVIERDPKDIYSSRQYEPTGVLTFKASWNLEWKQGTNGQTLIDQIPKMYEKLENRVAELLAGWERSRIAREQKEAADRRLEEIENIKKRELNNFKDLLAKSERWSRTQNLRNYLEYLTVAKGESDPVWMNWAKAKADWYDPMIEAEDELLLNIDRDTMKLIEQDF